MRAFCARGRAHRMHAYQIKSFAAKPRIPLVNSYLFFIEMVHGLLQAQHAETFDGFDGI
jgi:hypothetical protein